MSVFSKWWDPIPLKATEEGEHMNQRNMNVKICNEQKQEITEYQNK